MQNPVVKKGAEVLGLPLRVALQSPRLITACVEAGTRAAAWEG